MKCMICMKKTTWDESVGRPCYIVCNSCVDTMAKEQNKEPFEICIDILKKGWEMEEEA